MRKGITLSVGGRVELNLILEIGVLSESVTVTADVSLLETANATLGRVVSTEEVRSPPINHGNVDNLIRLGTGVGFTDDPAKDQPWEPLNTAYAMAGSVSSRNEFTLDGASNTLHDEGRGSIAQAWSPISDVMAEFKVQTATFDGTVVFSDVLVGTRQPRRGKLSKLPHQKRSRSGNREWGSDDCQRLPHQERIAQFNAMGAPAARIMQGSLRL